MGGPPPYYDSLDRSAASAAWLILPAINEVLASVGASLAGGAHVIPDRGATELDRTSQDRHRAIEQPFRILHLPQRREWMHPYPVKRFIGVDIAHAGDQALIQQRCFHGLFAFCNPGEKPLPGSLRFMDGIRRDLFTAEELAFVGHEREGAETARIVESKLGFLVAEPPLLAVEPEAATDLQALPFAGAGLGAYTRRHGAASRLEHLAGHAQVLHQREVSLETEQKILSAAAHLAELEAAKRFRPALAFEPDGTIKKLERMQTPPRQVAKAAGDCLYLG